ncbi:immunity protein YezG family protein [Nocardiopsis rhodophaea]
MRQEVKGTWYSMEYTIVRPGKFSTEFNYDRDPAFTLEPPPRNSFEISSGSRATMSTPLIGYARRFAPRRWILTDAA